LINNELLHRINTLSKKQREQGLSPAEKEEQAHLRRIYVDSVKDQVRNWLDKVELVNQEKLH